MQKFIVPNIGPLPCLVQVLGQDAKHMTKVLRLKPDDDLTITNGSGKDFSGRIVHCSPASVDIEITREITTRTESPLEITLCCGMLKDKKMDMIVKHVTQLGITKWIPFYCRRSVPKHDIQKARNKFDRWQAIVKESIKQCRRSTLPQISMPVTLEDLFSQIDDDAVKFIFWEDNAVKFIPPLMDPPPQKIILAIGPEGGFTVEEIDMAKSAGFDIYALGPRILRAETAAITATSLVQHLFGDL